jgi:hypothetical protein
MKRGPDFHLEDLAVFAYKFFGRAALATLLIGVGTPALAQAPHHEVTLVALEAPSERKAMVYVRREGGDTDIIALAPQALADDLTQALRLLAYFKANPTVAPSGNFMAVVRSEHVTRAQVGSSPSKHKVHEEYVAALKKASRRNIQGFGNVRSLRITVTDG